jgi:hypothetical protein
VAGRSSCSRRRAADVDGAGNDAVVEADHIGVEGRAQAVTGLVILEEGAVDAIHSRHERCGMLTGGMFTTDGVVVDRYNDSCVS